MPKDPKNPFDTEPEPEPRVLDPRDTAFAPENYAGLPGSPPVTDKGGFSRRLRPRKLSHRLKYVAQLAAMGLTQKQICEKTGYKFQRMSIVLNTPVVSNEVERTRRFMFEKDVQKSLKTMLPKALESIHQVLDHDASDLKEKKTKAEVAFTVLEHTHGKAKQQIEVGGNLLAELYQMLEERTYNSYEEAMAAEGHTLPDKSLEQKPSDIEDAEIISEPKAGGEPKAPSISPHEKPEQDAFDLYLDQALPKDSK